MRIKVAKVSDPPVLSDADIAALELESRRLSEAFRARTAAMEHLTADDLETVVR